MEVSSYCNAACVYCPHTAHRDVWLNRHLPLETFKRLLPAFAKTRLVFLQGWGEPFLHPDFLAMAVMAKEAGCQVGTTTNGMLVNSGVAHQLVECGVDMVAFSLAGVDEKNDVVRRGTSIGKVLAAIRTLHQAKERLGSTQPAIHIAYMLLRSGIRDVANLPLSLRGLGISQVVISTLDFVPCQELEDEVIIPSTLLEYHELRARLDAVKAEGERYGLEIHYQLYCPGERRLTCTENVQRALFVSADGAVSPCTFANLPVSEGACMFREVERPYRRLVFDNVNEAPLATIWRQKAYRAFRQSFYAGRLPALCQGCPKLFVA